MKKVLFQRGPDGKFHEFHVTPTDDPWQPIPGQDWALTDSIHGAGWFIVTSCRPIYRASTAHTEIRKQLEGGVNTVYFSHMEVFLEAKPTQGVVHIVAAPTNEQVPPPGK